MKTLLLMTSLLLFSCENTTNNEKVSISKGYVFLNQGTISSIDYYDSENDSIIKGIYQRNNNSETLSGYAEHINQNDDLISITMQGSYGTGEGGKVILLNKSFNKIAEITSSPMGHNTLYTVFDNNNLFVSYRKSEGAWPNTTYSYKIRKFVISGSEDEISVSQSGTDYTSTIEGYGFGRMKYLDGNLYINDNQQINIIDAETMSSQSTLKFPRSINDLAVAKGKLYVSIFNLIENQGKEDLKKGGVYILENGLLKDSILGDFGIKKLLSTKNELFGIKWVGSGRTYSNTTYSYEWENLSTSIVNLNNNNMISLFSNNKLSSISDGWVHFNYDEYNGVFLLTDAAYSNSKVSMNDISGIEEKTLTLIGQTCQVIILD